MTANVPSRIKDELESIEVILNHLANPHNCAGSDGEHIRAELAQSGHRKVILIQELLEKQPAE